MNEPFDVDARRRALEDARASQRATEDAATTSDQKAKASDVLQRLTPAAPAEIALRRMRVLEEALKATLDALDAAEQQLQAARTAALRVLGKKGKETWDAKAMRSR